MKSIDQNQQFYYLVSIIKYLSILSDLVEYFRQVLYNKGNEDE